MKNTQVLVFSYAGRVTATMTVDPDQFDADLFSRAYEAEFRQLAEELDVPDGGPRECCESDGTKMWTAHCLFLRSDSELIEQEELQADVSSRLFRQDAVGTGLPGRTLIRSASRSPILAGSVCPRGRGL